MDVCQTLGEEPVVPLPAARRGPDFPGSPPKVTPIATRPARSFVVCPDEPPGSALVADRAETWAADTEAFPWSVEHRVKRLVRSAPFSLFLVGSARSAPSGSSTGRRRAAG